MRVRVRVRVEVKVRVRVRVRVRTGALPRTLTYSTMLRRPP